MNTDSAPARHSLGRPVAAVPDEPGPLRPATDRSAPDHTGSGRTGADGMPGASFAVVERGYDPAQVDARLAELDRRLRDEIARADTAEAASTTSTAAHAPVRHRQDAAGTDPDDGGFGQRVERVLAAAEREAAELREKAAAEAAEILQKARADADRARTQTEEALLGRAAKLDDEFTARSAALDARAQEIDRAVERARTEAEEIRAEARRAAAEESASAERRAAEQLAQAERTIEQQRADATRDVGRMVSLRDEIRHELGRLQGLLRSELGDQPGPRRIEAVPDLPADLSTDLPDRTDLADLSGDRSADLSSDLVAELASGSPDASPDVSATIGTIPAHTTAAVGVLPFGDRSAGGPANGRSFAFGLVPGMRSEPSADEDGTGLSDLFRTSDDTTGRPCLVDRTPTRSTLPSRGRR